MRTKETHNDVIMRSMDEENSTWLLKCTEVEKSAKWCLSQGSCNQNSREGAKEKVRWKTQSAECGSGGVWKMRGVGNVEHFNFNMKLTNNLIPLYSHWKRKKKKKKKLDESFHFNMRRAGMVISVVVFNNAPVLWVWKILISLIHTNATCINFKF